MEAVTSPCRVESGEVALLSQDGIILPNGDKVPLSADCYLAVGSILRFQYSDEIPKETATKPKKHRKRVKPVETENTNTDGTFATAQPEVEATPASVETTAHEVAADPATSAGELGGLIEKTGGNAGLGVVLAVIAVVGGGAAWKFYSKFSEQKHEQAMRRLELDAQQAGLQGAQPPPCQAAQAKTEAALADLTSRLALVEKKSSSLDADFDGSDVERRLKKLERWKKDTEKSDS